MRGPAKAAEKDIRRAVEMIRAARRVVGLTGAGISVASGVPDFRSKGGLWERFDPMDYAHIDSFRADPERVWKMLKELREMVQGAAPNPAHKAMAELERLGKMEAIITQNVDNLHQQAGSGRVIEFHGNGSTLKCIDCGGRIPRAEADMSSLPPLCECGGPLKPGVIFFGEMIPQEALMGASTSVRTADLLLVVGTSATVAPASHIPAAARQNGARILEVNKEPTNLTKSVADLSLLGPAEQILPDIVKQLSEEG